MSTRLYLTADAAPVTPTTNGETWDLTDVANRLLSASKTAGAEVADTGAHLCASRRFVSAPLAAQTISGTVKSWAAAVDWFPPDAGTSLYSVYVVSGDGSTVRGTLLSYGVGSALTNGAHADGYACAMIPNGTALSSVAALAGDRLVVALGMDSQTDGSGASSLWVGNSSAAAADVAEVAGALITATEYPWVEFSGTIAFAGATPPIGIFPVME